MSKKINDALGVVPLAISLVSIHYGLGFLIGSGEAVQKEGPKGILYALSSGVGLLALSLVAPIYHKLKKPLWDLLGDIYGSRVCRYIIFLSSSWMLGVVASQIMGGASALGIFGLPPLVCLLGLALAIYVLSGLTIHNLSKIFLYLLIISSLLLLVSLNFFGFKFLPISASLFINDIGTISALNIIEIMVTTVLITVLGMDFHQFIVKSKSPQASVAGSILGGVVLILFSWVLLSILLASQTAGIHTDNGKELIPRILQFVGEKTFPPLGKLFALPIILVSIGSGSAVARIISKSIVDYNSSLARYRPRLLVVIAALLIGLTGKSLISLIVSFYAIYVGTLLIPSLAYFLLYRKNPLLLSQLPVEKMIIFSSCVSTIVLCLSLLVNIPFVSIYPGCTILAISIFLSLFILFIYIFLFYGRIHPSSRSK